MPTEFRSQLFGFNREDVFKYVHKKDFEMKAAKEKATEEISALKALVSKLQCGLDEAIKQNSTLSEDNKVMRERLDEFEAQIDSLNTTAEKIGKLYLVSKTSAKTIVDKAHESYVAIGNETSKNLENITVTQNALAEIKQNLISSTDEFVKELDILNQSLLDAKDKLESNSNEQVKISAEFAEIYQKLG